MTFGVLRRSAIALAGCIAGITLLTACGGGDAGGGSFAERTAFDVAHAAPDLTRAAGRSRYALEMTYTSTGDSLGDSTSTSTGEGTYDYAGQIGDGTLTTIDTMLGTLDEEVVFTNNVLYQREAGTDRWHKTDFSELVNTPVGQHDPSQQLDLLRGVSEDVREVGTADVRGDEVTQYAISIDPKRLADESGVVVDGGLTQAALSAAGPLPGQVFVDSDGRVRRLEVRMETAGADLAAAPELQEMLGSNPQVQEMLANRRTTMDISIEYFDFGVPVTAQVPDPSMVDTGPYQPYLRNLPDMSGMPGLPGGN